jgi:hypothetical protein
VQNNISRLNQSVLEAKKLSDDAKEDIRRKAQEINDIITKTREASVAAGAAVFTKDFDNHANILEKKATKWLAATIVFTVLTLAFAIYSYFFPIAAKEHLDAIQQIASKLAIIGILITATIWSGKIYKALLHQASTYRFKALGLQTFQAFSSGAADAQTKDAVLMETTRAIFSNQKTGYIEDVGGGDTQIVEVLKSVLPASEK